jgi:WD40 repeat protein
MSSMTQNQPNCLEFLDENLSVVGFENSAIKILDLRTGKNPKTLETLQITDMIVKELAGHHDAVTCLVNRQSFKSFFSGSHDGTIRSWDMRMMKCFDIIEAHQRKNDEGVMDMKLSPCGSRIISCK